MNHQWILVLTLVILLFLFGPLHRNINLAIETVLLLYSFDSPISKFFTSNLFLTCLVSSCCVYTYTWKEKTEKKHKFAVHIPHESTQNYPLKRKRKIYL